MNLNTGFFAAYNYRHKQPSVGYRLPINASFSKSARSSNESPNVNESFLPSITTNNSGTDGHRPYRRNDFANNHLFVAKQKLARIFLNQPATNIESKIELIHLFDRHDPKQRNRKINKNKRQENNSDTRSTPSLDQDAHLSVVNLIMKPSLPPPKTRDRSSAISHRRTQRINLQTKIPRSSNEWINPAIKQYMQSTSNHTYEDDLEPNTIINELIDNNPDIINSTSNPLDSSLIYVKSIIPSAGSQHR